MRSSYQNQQYYAPRRSSVSPQQPPRQKTPFLRPVIKLVVFLTIMLVAYFGITSSVSVIRASQKAAQIKAFDQKLGSVINPIITASGSKVGVAIYNLQTDSVHTYGVSTPMPAASTGKIIAALAYYNAVEQGKRDLTHILGNYNAGYQIQQMINQSNNDSWELLVNDLGRSALQQYAASIGSDYNVTDNTLSASSLAATLAKLYSGTLLNSADTNQLLSYMQGTNDEDLIPPALPSGITVYHKYGLLDGVLHDASILTENGKTYAFVIYTQSDDDGDDDARTTTIHRLTQVATSQMFAS
jgi:beta-lactamase class A